MTMIGKACTILTIVLFSACNQRAASEEDQFVALLKTARITDDPVIVGDWSMCSSSGNGMMIQYNSCTGVLFMADGTGFITKSSSVVENFRWTFQKSRLSILSQATQAGATFPDTAYVAVIRRNDDMWDLTISQPDNQSSFFLSRQICSRQE